MLAPMTRARMGGDGFGWARAATPWALALLLGGLGCGDSTPDTPRDAGAQLDADAGADLDAGGDAGSSEALEVEVLGEGEEPFDGRTHRYLLLRLERAGHVSYAQWCEPDEGVRARSPVVVQTRPYAGIDWTGEALDARWAALGDGQHPDVDGPAYDPETSSPIAYAAASPRRVVEDGMLYLLNGVPTLSIFGRFYAGGGPEDDIADMLVGLAYLGERDDVDPARIGVVGGSWGGFEAVYLTARAPAALRPRLTLALYPLTDFEAEWRFTDALAALEGPRRDEYVAFFEPYRRRIAADTGGGPPEGDFSGLGHADLALDVPILTAHDAEDTLVPFSMAEDFAAAFDVTPLTFRQPEPADPAVLPPSHGASMAEHALSVYTVLLGRFLAELLPPDEPVLLAGDGPAFAAMLGQLRAQADRGQPLDALPELLAALLAERVSVFDTSTGMLVPGARFVSDGFNAAWGTAHTPETLGDALSAL